MIIANRLAVPADPDEVFALVNDVERVAGCLPGATLDGRDGDEWRGRVAVKVGPVGAAYAGRLRFTEIDPAQRRLRMVARGTDGHGSGDAEAAVTLTVREAPDGAVLDLHTDLLIRGKIARFGKGAIEAVSGRLLDAFARNLVAELRAPHPDGVPVGTPPPPVPDSVAAARQVRSPSSWVRRFGPVVAAGLLGWAHGWLFGRLRAQQMVIEELRRAR